MRFCLAATAFALGLMLLLNALQNTGVAEMRRLSKPTVPPDWAKQFDAPAEPAAVALIDVADTGCVRGR